MFFRNGWPDFVKDNYLEIGDFLVFEYDGKSTFNVKIYGRNACEKDIRVVKKNNDNPISLEKKGKQVQEKESFGKKAIKSNKRNCELNYILLFCFWFLVFVNFILICTYVMCYFRCLGEYNISSKEPVTVSDDEEERAIENSEISCFIATRDGTILILRGVMASNEILNFFY